ncbi:energy transducer TonB [Mucilaginibacter sp.]|uniref:energy transducer TonB n=1 Tax=Mucilaginibacter sp. TaxID=1882438 RepID=UPI00344D84CA
MTLLIKIVKKLNDDCDLEALRLIKASPKWSPATISGKVVRCGYTFPVKFKLI